MLEIWFLDLDLSPPTQHDCCRYGWCELLFNMYHHKFSSLNQEWLSTPNLQQPADAVHDAGAPLTNYFGFIDGTVRPICRPEEMQRVVYNGHRRVHALKFQSIATPNGLRANLFGPVDGCRHDSGMLADSDIYQQLQQFAINPQGVLVYLWELSIPLEATTTDNHSKFTFKSIIE